VVVHIKTIFVRAMALKDDFLKSIHEKRIVRITFNSYEKGIITRNCIPYDFGMSRNPKLQDGRERYHFYDLNSPDGQHNLSILPEQLLKLELLAEHFEPAQYVTWKPRWFVQRDWGKYS